MAALDWNIFIAMTGTVLLLAATPGPVVVATVARAATGGVRSAIPFLTGVLLADLIYAGLAVMGLTVIAARYGPLFEIVKYCGALYLIYLGVQIIRSASAQNTPVKNAQHSVEHPFLGIASGLIITLGNPKLILFYVSFLPAFIALDQMSTIESIFVCFWIGFLFFLSNCLWAFLASPVGHMMARRFGSGGPSKEKGNTLVKQAGGSLLVGSGAWLMFRS